MNCPVCNVPLLLTERQSVEIDYCPKCRGVWLDRGELDKIIERSAAEIPAKTSPEFFEGRIDRRGEEHHDKYHDDHHDDYQPRKKRSFLQDLFD